jgi:hypothetical protein
MERSLTRGKKASGAFQVSKAVKVDADFGKLASLSGPKPEPRQDLPPVANAFPALTACRFATHSPPPSLFLNNDGNEVALDIVCQVVGKPGDSDRRGRDCHFFAGDRRHHDFATLDDYGNDVIAV